MKKNKFYISISKKGKVTFIYNDDLASLLKTGGATITRVSSVEPCDGGWSAQMIDGPLIGPFPLRQQALDAEIAYLNEKLFGVKT